MLEVFTFDEDRRHALVKRAVAVAFCTGFVLAMASSGSLALDRAVGHGSARFAFASTVAVAGVSALALMIGFRSRPLGSAIVLVPQLAGAVAGVVVTHVLLVCLTTSPGLTETPRQFMNDAVAAFAIIAVIHACGAGALNFAPLIVSLFVVTVYSATAGQWHVDHPPRAFEIGVQELVLTQVTSVSIALIFLRLAMATSRPDSSR